jgi:hypothetical protein
MNRGLGLLWLVIFVAALIFIGQTVGLYDLPMLRDLRLPLGVGPGDVPPITVAIAPSIAPSPSPAVVRPTVVASGPCSAGRLSFANGMADLKTALGTRMGEPTECERVVDAAGNTEQQTSTGLAYYRAQANVVVFTDGIEHWALTSNGVVHWTSDEVEPPRSAEQISPP